MDIEVQIIPLEPRLNVILLRDGESLSNLSGDYWGCCCSESEDSFDGEVFCEVGQFKVIWAEVMSPLRNAVGFVYSKERNSTLF